jgi:hypothetical protein
MICSACRAFDAAERASIEGKPLPEHVLNGGCSCQPSAADLENAEKAMLVLRDSAP